MQEYKDITGLSPEEMAGKDNIAEYISDEELAAIGGKVVRGYEEDEDSRKEWKKKYKSGLELALQVYQEKTHPWPKAANVKFPLMTVACLQFHARAYPALCPSGGLVTAKTVSNDPDGSKTRRGVRIETHMNYQLKEEMENWEEDMDRLLITLPITGTEFKKIYYDGDKKQNTSEHVFAKDLVVHYYAKSLEKAQRITHILEYSQNEIMENINSGVFLDVELGKVGQARSDEMTQVASATQGMTPPVIDEDTPRMILEQHGYCDLDGDGYKEPYIFTVDRETKKVLRIVARYNKKGIKKKNGKVWKITPEHYFEVFKFIPSPDGGFYGLGFMHLIGPINEAVNTAINQLLDAGSLSNLQSGFLSKSFRSKGGTFKFEPGEWKPVNMVGADLKQGIFPLPVREPSNVLFQLLGFLVEAGQRVTSTTDIMVGENPGQNQKATTTLTVMENGMKVFTAIYKRVRKALDREFKKLYNLNYTYFDRESYLNIIDSLVTPEEVPLIELDYNYEDCDIIPSADPEASSKAIERQKAEILVQLIPMGLPRGIVLKRLMEAMDIPHIEEFQLDQLNQPPPDPEMMLKFQEFQRDTELEGEKLELDKREQHRKEVETGIKGRQISNDFAIKDKKISSDTMLGVAELSQNVSEGEKDRNAEKDKPKPK